MGRPTKGWFSQLLEGEEREEMGRNRKVKTEEFFTIDPYKMGIMLDEEEEDMEVLT
jgi:hypothetical protein